MGNILMKGNIFFSLYPLWFTYWLRGIFFFHFIPNGWHIDQGAYFFFIVDLLLNVRVRFRKGKIFFSFWSIYGTFFFTRKTVKALRARSARFARSAPQPAFGRPWRALRWDNLMINNFLGRYKIYSLTVWTRPCFEVGCTKCSKLDFLTYWNVKYLF